MIAATMFSGIGAPECAMPEWDWRWSAEIEKFPGAVLEYRHPKSINLGDVNAEDFVKRAEATGRPDVVVFGSPCQDFSVAGQRVGLDGDRGNLALVALGVINRIRPRWVVFENVPGLLSSFSGGATAESSIREGPIGGGADSFEDSDFAAFLTLVQQCGYFGCYRITDAQYAGVPQRRRRIFAVFHLGDWRPAAAVLFEPEGLRGDRAPSRETGEGIAGTVAASSGKRGGVSEGERGGLIHTDVVSTLSEAGVPARPGDNIQSVDYLIATDGPVGSVSSKWAKGTGGPAGDECYNLCVAVFKPSHYTRGKDGHPSGVSPPLGAEPDKGDQEAVLMTGTAVRRLTPRECERLQAFPDDYTLIPYRGALAADGPRYKALGNAMNVKEVQWVLKRIDKFSNRKRGGK